jgi:DNA-binding NtrC family response regulator
MTGDVLVVEHDAQIRAAISLFLIRAEIQTRSADNTLCAIAALHEVPALVVLDLMLPDRGGVEVLRAISEHGLKTRVALIASGTDAESFEAATAFCPDAIFGRPFDFQDFADWLSQAFGVPQAFGPVAKGRAARRRPTAPRPSIQTLRRPSRWRAVARKQR